MKKILISISLLFATLQSVKAQDIQVLDSPPNWTFMLSNLNITQITSGILYNKVGMFSNLYDYNRGKYNLSHADHFMQSINELYYASGETKFMSAAQLKASLTASSTTMAANATAPTQGISAQTTTTATATVDISIINTTLHQLNFNEKNPATGGLTFVNGKFVPIVGQPAFLSRKILLAAPLQETVSGTAIKYTFANALIYNNATTAIKKLVVYFSDNTPVTVIDNSVLLVPSKTISYTASGGKLLQFVATFTDNTTVSTAGYHYFNYKTPRGTTGATSANPCEDIITERGIFKSTIGFQGYNETAEYLGKFDYTVFYHSTNSNGSVNTTERKMLKPILILDGFDPGDTRKTTDCDCEQDPDCKLKNSDKSFAAVSGQFLPTLQYTFNPIKHESIRELMEYSIGNNQTKNLITTLREQGYDVIILNIPKYSTTKATDAINTPDYFAIDGGADYVERNGRALASYIQDTKAKLLQNGSLENLVIMGPSMGGLISRYALAYMEKKEFEAITPADKAKWKHNTRIWVSFDSPHLGANIPVGAQANIWFLGEKLRNSAAEEKFNTQLNSYAGKQMLISQFSNTLATLVGNAGASSNAPYFVQFQSNLNNNGVAGSGGFPVSNASFRKIAIVNGSLSGTKNGVAGGEFLNIRGYKDPSITEGIIGGAIVGSAIPFVGTFVGGLLGGLFGASNANITVLRCRDSFYPAYGQTGDIFNGDGQNFTIGWSQWYINHKWYNLTGTNNSIRGSLDIVPAGTFTTGKILRDEIVKGLDDGGLSSEIRGTNIDTHSFIPAFSALAHLQSYQDWSNPLNSNLTCSTNKQTPFDSYFGATANTPHISLTKEMVTWLMKEIGDLNNAPTPQVQSFPIDPATFTGPSTFCENTAQTYQFNDLCKIPGKATFTVTGNIVINSFTDYSVTVQSINGGGAATITADFGIGQILEKKIWVGKPSFMFQYNYFQPQPIKSTICAVSTTPDRTLQDQGVTSVVFKLCSATTPLTSFADFCVQPRNSCCIQVTATNACGSTTELYDCFLSRQMVNNNYFYIYPNPSKDIVNLDLRDASNQPAKGTVIFGELFDIMGLQRAKVEIVANKATFSVLGLNKGIYILKIYLNNQVEAHQIAVE